MSNTMHHSHVSLPSTQPLETKVENNCRMQSVGLSTTITNPAAANVEESKVESSSSDLRRKCKFSSRASYNTEERKRALKHQKERKRSIEDIDSSQFLTSSYDPSYAWSIWMQQKKAELTVDGISGDWCASSSSSSTATSKAVAAKQSVPFTIRQPELDEGMRCALLEWLAEVSLEYKMQTSTYFLAVRLLDRVLLQLPIRKTKFQLLGCACLMIAGKLEEIEAPTIENLVFLSDNSFDIESLVVMEHTVLKMLDFNVSVHTSYYFGTRLALAAQMTEKEKSFMFFLIEISLYDFTLCSELTSKVAAAAAHLTIQALRSLDSPVWTAALEHYSGGYKDSDPTVRDLIYRLSQLHWNMESSPYSNMGKKFAKVSRHRVSLTGALRADKIRFSVCAPPEEQIKVTEESDMTTCDSAAMHSVALSLPISPHESEAPVLLESIVHEDDLPQRVVHLSSEDDMDAGHERLSDTCCASDDSLDLHLEAPLTDSYQDALNTIPLSLPDPLGCAPTIIVSGSVLAAESAIHIDTKPMDDVTDAADTISAAVGTTESGRSSSALIVDANRSVNCYAVETKLESKTESEVEGNLMVPRTEESTLTSICTTGTLNSTDVCKYYSAPTTSIKKYWHSPSSSLFMDLILSPCTTTDKSEIPCGGISRDLALELEDTQPPLSIALCAASEQTVHPSVKALMPATRKSTKTICSKSNTHGSGTATEAKAGSETVSVSEELKATVEVEEASSSRYSKRISTRRCK